MQPFFIKNTTLIAFSNYDCEDTWETRSWSSSSLNKTIESYKKKSFLRKGIVPTIVMCVCVTWHEYFDRNLPDISPDLQQMIKMMHHTMDFYYLIYVRKRFWRGKILMHYNYSDFVPLSLSCYKVPKGTFMHRITMEKNGTDLSRSNGFFSLSKR